jgi:hypothetical protein
MGGLDGAAEAAPFQGQSSGKVRIFDMQGWHFLCSCVLRVRLAFLAAVLREADPRLRAALRACLESDAGEAAERPFFFRAFEVALDRLAEGLRREWLCPLR